VLKQYGINVEANKEFCGGCALGKAHRQSFRTQTSRLSIVGKQINADVCGPVTERSVGGADYYGCFKDDYSKFHHVFFITTKSEVADCLRKFLKELKTAGHVTKGLLSDGGKEFNCEAVQKVLEEHSITYRLTIPCTPEQNGAAEQKNHTIVGSARSVLHASGLPKELWAEACNTVVYILNHTGPTPVEGKTPLELWTRSYATLGHLRVFGTECYVHIPIQKRHKWNQKSKLGQLVRYIGEKDGYQIWIPNKRKTVLSCDVLFKPEVVCNVRSDITRTESTCPTLHVAPSEEIQVLQNYKSDDGNTSSTYGGSNGSNSERYFQDCKSIREKKQPNWMTSGEFICLVDETQGDYCLSPISYTEVMQSNEQKQRTKVMNKELASLKENETWELVNRPINIKVIQNCWVMCVKITRDGNTCFKARLVAKGYAQKQGIDYDITFSAIACYDTIHTLIAVATSKKYEAETVQCENRFPLQRTRRKSVLRVVGRF